MTTESLMNAGYTFDTLPAMAGNSDFWRQLIEAIAVGIRDIRSGEDRVLAETLDSRVVDEFTLDYALIRALAMAWRAPHGQAQIPVRVFSAMVQNGAIVPREVEINGWDAFGRITCSGDGATYLTRFGSQSRKLRIARGVEDLENLLGGTYVLDEQQMIPGNATLMVGHTGEDAYLAKVLERAGDSTGWQGVMILFLYAPDADLVGIGDAGGTMRNLWRSNDHAVQALNDSHLTDHFRKLIMEIPEDPWRDEEYRKNLFTALNERAKGEGKTVNLEMFLNTLAESSPLRRVFPTILTKIFPEIEQIFFCCNDELWDHSSPAERYPNLISRIRAQRGQTA